MTRDPVNESMEAHPSQPDLDGGPGSWMRLFARTEGG